MPFTHNIRQVWASAGDSVDRALNLTPDAEDKRSLSVATGVTDQQVLIAFTLASLVDYYIVSDKNVTLETNSITGAGGDVISLVAGQPITWSSAANQAKHFTVDVTTIYLTNASGATATIEIRIGKDSTP